jgi:hypothetical protein
MHTKYMYISHVSVKSCKAILSYVKDGKCNCKNTPQNTHVHLIHSIQVYTL